MHLPLPERSLTDSGLPTAHWFNAWESQLPARLSALLAGPNQATQGLLQGLSSRQQQGFRRLWAREGEKRAVGRGIAALTLLTEISISVMAVGTWGRSRVSVGAGGVERALHCFTAFSILQPLPWSVHALAAKASLSQRSGYKKGCLALAGLQAGGLAKSTNPQCLLPQPYSPAMKQLSQITIPRLKAHQSPRYTRLIL